MAERTNPHANLIIGAQDEASPVFDKIKASSQSMATGVEQAAKQAAKGTQLLGDEAEKSHKKMNGLADPAVPAAQKFQKSTESMIRQIRLLNAELEAGGRNNSEFIEKKASIYGADTLALAPYLADLKKAEAAQRVATTGLDQMGMSAKQTTAALRQVPMQFTDIVVSLQGGQSAMQVFLQQGGQLKDMFGGAGNAARALGGYVIGLVNPFTVAAAAVAGFGLAMASVNSKDAALLALSTQLAATGRASAGAVGEIKALVKELNLIPGVSKASATAIITEFAKVNGIGSDLFKSLGSSVADFAAATGTDLPTAAKKLADAFADPAKGAQALEGALGTLTAAQILSIEKMAAMGDKSGAQVAMMDALKQATEGLAKQGMTPLGEATDKMSNAWDALTSSIGNSEAFRTANSWLATLIEKVAELTVRLSQMKPPTWLQFLPVVGPAIGALTMAGGASSGSRSVSGVVGTWDEGGATGSWGPTASETEQQVKAAIAATRGYETQSAAMEKLRGVASQAKDALKELESQNRGGSVEAMRLRDSIAAMNEKLADMGKKGAPKGPAKETISEYDKLIKKLSDELPRAAAEAEAAQMGYNKAQTEFLALAGSPAWASFSNSQRAVVASMFEGKIASEEAGEAAKALSKAYAEAAAERIKTIQSMERAADSLQSQNDALREEIELIGLSTEQQTLVLQQRNDVIILTKEATLAELERQSAITGTQTRVEIALASEIDALKERNALLGAKGVKNAAVDAAKSAADEWQKTTDSINQSLTDSLLRGFESGKDFAKNLRDTVVNMFKTMVLRPVISAIVNPVAGAVTGMLGLSGAQVGGNSVMGGIQTASNLNSLYGAGAQALWGGTAGASAASLGYANIVGMAGGDAIGALAAANGMWTGVATGAQAAAQAAIASNAAMAAGTAAALPAGTTAAAAGAGAGAGGASGALAAIPGWGWALAGVALLGSLAKKFDDSGTPHIGAGAIYSEAGGLQEGADIYNGKNFGMGMAEEYAKGTQEGVSTIAKSLTQTFDGIAKAFGQTAGYEIATAFADDSSKDGAWGSLRISQEGRDLLNWNDTRESKWAPREFANGEDGYKEYLAEIAKDTRTVLLDMDLPSWADTMLESIGDAADMDQLAATVQQIGVIQTTFVQLGKTMEGFAGLTDKAFEALMRASGGFESLAANAGTYYENFYSEAEKTAAVTRSVSESLAQVGLAMPATRDEFRALVESQLAMGEAGAEAVAALLGVSGAFASVTATAADAVEAARQLAEEQSARAAKAAKAAQDAAYSDFRRAVDRDRSVLQDQASMLADTIGSIADAVSILKSNARELYGTVDSTAQMLAAQGMVYIENALASVRAGGSVADYTGLSDAIGAARSGIDSGSYATQFDRERDALVLAGQLSELGTLGDLQLSIEERQLRAINSQLEYLDDLSQRAEDMVNGTTALTETVDTYFARLMAFLDPQSDDTKTAGNPVVSPYSGVQGSSAATAPGRGGYAQIGLDYEIDKYVKANFGTGSAEEVRAIADFGKYNGWTINDYASALKLPPKDLEEYFKANGIPAFAVGTNYVPRDMLAQIHEGEAIVPKAYNPWANGQAMQGGDPELLAEMRAMRAELAALRAAASATANNTAAMPQMADQFDTVTNGGNAMRAKALA